MSFQSMLESNECGQTNPMIDLARQLTSSSSPASSAINNVPSMMNESLTFVDNNGTQQQQQQSDNPLSSAVESLLLNTNGGDPLESSAFNMESLLEEMNRMESKLMMNDDQHEPPDSIRSLMKTDQDPFWNEFSQNLIYDDQQQQQQQSLSMNENNNKLPELNVDWADEYLRKLELNNNDESSATTTIKASNVVESSSTDQNSVDGSWDLNEKAHQLQTDQRQSIMNDDYRNQPVDNVDEFFPQHQQQQQPQSFLPFLRPIIRNDFGTHTSQSTISDVNLNDLVSDQESRLINMLLGNNNNQTIGENQVPSSPSAFQSTVIGSTLEPDRISREESSQQRQQPVEQPSMKLGGDEVKTGENFFYENQFDDMEFWMKLAEEWHSNDIIGSGTDLLADVDTNVVQILEPLENLLKSDHRYYYELIENNPFILVKQSQPAAQVEKTILPDYIEQGKQRMNQGDLSAAVLLFEAAVQQQPENVDAWRLLGIANAKNENDHKSIAAFKRCLSLQPKDEQIIRESLMYLATSFTNESMTTEACNALQEWLNNHPKYRDLMNKESEDEPYLGPTPLSKRWMQKTVRVGNPFSNGLFDSVRQNFLEAARLSSDEQPDPDVQCGLGVLHNLSGEYEKAIDCFRLALDSLPDDYALWNRYGASLANGGRAEESMSAYREALIRYPGYIRARYNLAISCMMMGFGEEAAEHLLSVLNLQTAGADSIKDMVDLNRDNITSVSVWSLLRSAMSMHGRIDLLDLVDKRDLEQLTKEFHKPKPSPEESEDYVDADNGNEDQQSNSE